MNSNVFRQKNLDRVNSPEDLNRYLKVTNPPVWFILALVFLLLAGAIVWACVAKVETKAPGVVVADETSVKCYVSEQNIKSIHIGTIVRVDGKEYTVKSISGTPESAATALTPYCITLGEFELGENVYELTLDGTMTPGNYSCKIVLESVSPITFLTNSSN